MNTLTYKQRRTEIETYFDRTAVEAWSRLTSNAPVGRIRQTVRAGRDRMRNTLLDWLPADLTGQRVLDAGCGTGALAVEAARRGAEVVAVDLSPKLIELARSRVPDDLPAGRITHHVGDMWDPALGRFQHIVAMDSLIHYQVQDAVRTLAALAALAERSVLFTFAPRTPLLTVMHTVGRWFPKSDRAPSIEPVDERHLAQLLSTESDLSGWGQGRSECIASGFYTSRALELVRL
jgi:magnesium-protoporphyrin O-methyltransferase